MKASHQLALVTTIILTAVAPMNSHAAAGDIYLATTTPPIATTTSPTWQIERINPEPVAGRTVVHSLQKDPDCMGFDPAGIYTSGSRVVLRARSLER